MCDHPQENEAQHGPHQIIVIITIIIIILDIQSGSCPNIELSKLYHHSLSSSQILNQTLPSSGLFNTF